MVSFFPGERMGWPGFSTGKNWRGGKFWPVTVGLYTCGKTLKNVYKIRIQRDLKLATNGRSDKGFLLTSKVCSQGVFCPWPGAIYMYKIIKNVYKIRFWRDHFETCNITQVNVKAPEVTYNALVSAFFRTGAGENAIPTIIIMFVWGWFNLMLITHGAQTIDKIAVYDIATNFMVYLMVYSVNHGQV